MPARTDTGVRVLAREFPGHSALAADPVLGEYLADLARPYGVEVDAGLLAAGAGHSYGEMGEELVRALLAPLPGLDVDLLVLAQAVPDVRPGRSTALYLSALCPGRPLAFAISEQGSAAAFTAVRVAGEYLRTGAARNALVLMLEQSALPYPTPAELPDAHAGVAVLHHGVGPTVRQEVGLGPAEAAVRFEALAGRFPADVTVLGPGLAAATGSGRVERPAGRPLTGVWAALAGVAAAGGEAVLADYDAGSATLSLCHYPGSAWTG